jgi:hypothetical protein
MSKKNKKPQVRKRQKPTTGQLKFQDVVYLEREKVDGVVQVYATCTCDKWRSSPEATTITKAALEAKQHVLDSGGDCLFRQHDVPADMLPETEEEAGEYLAGETGTEVEPTPKE